MHRCSLVEYIHEIIRYVHIHLIVLASSIVPYSSLIDRPAGQFDARRQHCRFATKKLTDTSGQLELGGTENQQKDISKIRENEKNGMDLLISLTTN